MSVDYRELQELQKRMQNFIDHGADELCRDCTNELTARLYRTVVRRTPQYKGSEKYPAPKTVNVKIRGADGKLRKRTFLSAEGVRIKHGGTLKRGWNVSFEGGGVKKNGNTYERVLSNPVYYASYVEYGHRQEPGRFVPQIGRRLKDAWVPGQHFVKKSEQDIQKIAPALIQKKLDEKMKEMLNGS